MERIASVGADPAGELRPLVARTHRFRRVEFYAALAIADGVSICGGFATASAMRFGSALNEQAITLSLVMLPLYWLLAGKAYGARAIKDWRRGLTSAYAGLAFAILLVLFFGFATRASDELSRIVLGIGLVFAVLYMGVARGLLGKLAYRVFNGEPMMRLFIDDGLAIACPRGHRFVSARRFGVAPTLASPHFMDRLAQAIEGADSVTIACPPERREIWAMALKGSDVRAGLIIPELKSIGSVGVLRVGELPIVLVSTGPLSVRDQILKRVLDLALAVPMLIFLTPLMVFVALAIKIDSRGPVFFTQQRVGFGNRLFKVFKFRSMRVDSADHAGGKSASRDDDRITSVGRFIRSTSIDELPQLLNILRGDMSFVGPRPHALGSLAGDELFWEVDARYWHRHACKPGLTGLAQVRGFRGATHRREDLIDRLQSDLEYVNGWSLVRDISILFATIRVVVHRNAY